MVNTPYTFDAKAFPDSLSIGPIFYMPDVEGIEDVRKYLEEKTDAQCNFAGCGIRNAATKDRTITPDSIWEPNNDKTPNVPTMDGKALEDDLSNAIYCYICGFVIDGRRGIALEIQNAWGGQCEHVMAVAALATLCGLAGENYNKIVNQFIKDCNLNNIGTEYLKWRNKLVHQQNNSGGGKMLGGADSKEGGGPPGILYKWAHAGCNEIKGSNPYLGIDFGEISNDENDNWYTMFTTNQGGGGKMIGGNSIYCDDVIKWNLACMCGNNKGKPGITDGGKKSMFWRKRYDYLKKGVDNINVEAKITSSELKAVLDKSIAYFRDKGDKAKAEGLKKSQRKLIENDQALTEIDLYEEGQNKGKKLTDEWIDERLIIIKEKVLTPIVENIVQQKENGEKIEKNLLRQYICISQCILTRVFEKNLTSAVGKILNSSDFKVWSYAPASQLSSAIINAAFTEVEKLPTDDDKKKYIRGIFTSYKDRLKSIGTQAKVTLQQVKSTTKAAIAKAKTKAVAKTKKIGKALNKTGAKIKNVIKSKKGKKGQGGGGYKTLRTGRKRKTIKRSRLYGGERELLPYRIAIFTSNNTEMKRILRGHRFNIYSDYLASNSKLTQLGNSRIMRWLSLLLSDLDIDHDLLHKYSFELNIIGDKKQLPIIFEINVVCNEIQNESPTYEGDNLLLELYNQGKLFIEGDDMYNLGMYKYLTALTLSDRIPGLLDELMYTFDLKFYAQLEMRGIDINEVMKDINNEDMRGKAPVNEESVAKSPEISANREETPSNREETPGDSEDSGVFSPVDEPGDHVNNDISRGKSKRKKTSKKEKRGKKRSMRRKLYRGGSPLQTPPLQTPPLQTPSYEGLINANKVIQLNGTNFLSDYITEIFINEGNDLKISEIQDYEKSFLNIMAPIQKTDDYQVDSSYGEISHEIPVSPGFDSDPIFSLLNGRGKTEIKTRGKKIKDKWTVAKIQHDDRDTRIFYILGMIDYLSGIDIYSYDGNGKDPVEKYLEGLKSGTTHPIEHGTNQVASDYSESVRGKTEELLSGIEEDDCNNLLSYFGMSYGPNSDTDVTDDTIYETIKLSSNSNKTTKIKEYIRKFVINVTMVNVMTYPYIRCYVNYDPAYKRYMWLYDPIMEDDDGYGRNFCRTTRRYQGVWSDSDIHTSVNPYTFAYEE